MNTKFFDGIDHYGRFLRSLCETKKISSLNLSDDKITRELFYNLCMLRFYEWEMRVKCDLRIKHTSSDYFRDMVAFYLRCALDDRFKVQMERKEEGIRPDIVIGRDRPVFAIEVKTTIGWDRGLNNFDERIEDISEAFKIAKKSIIYVLEAADNVGKKFESNYWNDNSSTRKIPREHPYNKVYPLFLKSADPYYWKESKQIDRDREILPEEKIKSLIDQKYEPIFKIEEIFKKITESI